MPDQRSITGASLVFVFVVVLVLLPSVAFAAKTAGSLPWEKPLTTIQTSMTGTVAYTISLMGVVVAGATLVFGGEISDFVRRIIMLVLVISVLISATNILSTIFNAGAVL